MGIHGLLTEIALLCYTLMTFVPHSKYVYRPPLPVTGTAFSFYSPYSSLVLPWRLDSHVVLPSTWEVP
jgi:hypothetical protein